MQKISTYFREIAFFVLVYFYSCNL